MFNSGSKIAAATLASELCSNPMGQMWLKDKESLF
jgi:hypothetical protein